MSAPTVTIERERHAFPLARWAVQHPLTAYFAVAFLGTWLVWSPMFLGVDGLGLLPVQVSPALYMPLFILATFAGPTLAAYLVTAALEGRHGMFRLLQRYWQWRVGLLPWVLSVFGYPLLFLVVGTVVLGAAPLQGLAANPLTLFTNYLPALLIFPALITWGEEPGWRGFAQTRMQAAYHPLIATLVVGFMHALWHLPMYVVTAGPNAAGPFNPSVFATNTLTIMLITIVWTWVFNRGKQSILIAVLLHASTNATLPWINSFAPELVQNSTVGLVVFAIIGVLALLLVVVTKGRLGYSQEKKLS